MFNVYTMTTPHITQATTMSNILTEYSELTKQINCELNKVYKKTDAGEELDSAVKSIHIDASAKTKQLIETLVHLTGASEYALELISDLKELTKKEQEFIFEDSEGAFSELTNIAM